VHLALNLAFTGPTPLSVSRGARCLKPSQWTRSRDAGLEYIEVIQRLPDSLFVGGYALFAAHVMLPLSVVVASFVMLRGL